MPTNEERREVARKLRKVADILGENMDGHEFAHYVADSILGNYHTTWKKLTLIVADLIEPEPERTCEILHDDNLSEQYGGPMARCSYCGVALPEEFIGPYYYCPCCGSKNKVVEQ